MAGKRLRPERIHDGIRDGTIHWWPAAYRHPYDAESGSDALVCHDCDVILVRRYDPNKALYRPKPGGIGVRCYKCESRYYVPSIVAN
jgi:hypothetical protein